MADPTPPNRTQVEETPREPVRYASPASDAAHGVVPDARALAALPLRSKQRYHVIAEHKRGGLGRILKVFDRDLGRELALKEALDTDRQAMQRFTREALTTARLEHPSIVPVHDAGCDDSGEPFYTMKLVSGLTLTEVIEAARDAASRMQSLPAVLAVSEAIAYSHDRRVLHRDLKPDNVLVGAFGETVVIDWGLAKDLRDDSPEPVDVLARYRADDKGLTVMGAVVGTPAFMPPEQARGEAVDERADVYSLGATLYFVLTGQTPYPGTESKAVLEAVKAGAPSPVRSLAPEVPKDLAAIVDKAMARERTDRYLTAKAFSDDLKRFLARQPVSAHRYSVFERGGRWLQRHRGIAILAFVALLVLGAGTTFATFREATLRQNAEQSTRALMEEQGRSELAAGHPRKAAVYLAEALRRSPDDLALRHLLTQALRPLAAKKHAFVGHQKDVVSVDFSADGTRVISGGDDKTVRLWNAKTGELVKVLATHQKTLDVVVFNRDGTLAASGGLDDVVNVYRIDPPELVSSFKDDNPYRVAFTPDGTRIVCGSQFGEIRVHDLKTGEVLHRLKQHTARAHEFTFTPAGELAVASWDHSFSVWNLGSGTLVKLLDGYDSEGSSVAFSHDGKWVALAESDNQIHIVQVDGWKRSHSIRTPEGSRWPRITFSPDDQLLIARNQDGVMRAYHASSGALLAAADVENEGKLFSSALNGAGTEVVTAGLDGRVESWALSDAFDFEVIPFGAAHRSAVYPSEVSPDGQRLFLADEAHFVTMWNAKTLGQTGRFEVSHEPFSIAVSDANETVAFSQVGQGAHVVEVFRFDGSKVASIDHPKLVYSIAASRDGQHFATICYDGKVRWFSARDGSAEGEVQVTDTRLAAVAFSPEGKQLAIAEGFGKIFFVDVAQKKVTGQFQAHATWIDDVAYSADGTRLITGGRQDHQVKVWNLNGNTLVHTFTQQENNVMKVAFSADGKLAASAAMDHSAVLYDAVSGKLLRKWKGPSFTAEFTPDGKRLLTTGHNGYAVLWNIEPDRRSVETLTAEVAARAPWRIVDGVLRAVAPK